MREKVLVGLNIFVIALGIVVIFFCLGIDDGQPDYFRLARTLGMVVIYFIGITRYFYKEKTDWNKLFADEYGHIIKDTFKDDKKKYNRLMKGLKYYNEERLGKAIKVFYNLWEQCEAPREYAVVEFFWGCSNMDAGHYDDAIENFEQALEGDSSIVEARNNLGACYKLQGDLQKAINYFEEVLKYSLNEAYTYVNLADCYKMQANWDKTLFYSQEALRVDGTDTDAMALAYMACERLNDWHNAKRYKEMYFVNGGTKDDLEEYIGELEVSV